MVRTARVSQEIYGRDFNGRIVRIDDGMCKTVASRADDGEPWIHEIPVFDEDDVETWIWTVDRFLWQNSYAISTQGHKMDYIKWSVGKELWSQWVEDYVYRIHSWEQLKDRIRYFDYWRSEERRQLMEETCEREWLRELSESLTRWQREEEDKKIKRESLAAEKQIGEKSGEDSRDAVSFRVGEEKKVELEAKLGPLPGLWFASSPRAETDPTTLISAQNELNCEFFEVAAYRNVFHEVKMKDRESSVSRPLELCLGQIEESHEILNPKLDAAKKQTQKIAQQVFVEMPEEKNGSIKVMDSLKISLANKTKGTDYRGHSTVIAAHQLFHIILCVEVSSMFVDLLRGCGEHILWWDPGGYVVVYPPAIVFCFNNPETMLNLAGGSSATTREECAAPMASQRCIKGTLSYMIQNCFPSGNSLSNQSLSDHLVHWCHGAHGNVLTLIKAASVFKTREIVKATMEAGEVEWNRGLLKQVGICQGMNLIWTMMMRQTSMVNNLGTIINSGIKGFIKVLHARADVSVIEQFEIGFYFAKLGAEKVIITTKHNDNEQYIWESQVGGSFTATWEDLNCKMDDNGSHVWHRWKDKIPRESTKLLLFLQLNGTLVNCREYKHEVFRLKMMDVWPFSRAIKFVVFPYSNEELEDNSEQEDKMRANFQNKVQQLQAKMQAEIRDEIQQRRAKSEQQLTIAEWMGMLQRKQNVLVTLISSSNQVDSLLVLSNRTDVDENLSVEVGLSNYVWKPGVETALGVNLNWFKEYYNCGRVLLEMLRRKAEKKVLVFDPGGHFTVKMNEGQSKRMRYRNHKCNTIGEDDVVRIRWMWDPGGTLEPTLRTRLNSKGGVMLPSRSLGLQSFTNTQGSTREEVLKSNELSKG